MNTRCFNVVNVGISGSRIDHNDVSQNTTSSSAWLTMYVSCSGKSLKFNVCSTRLEHGAAKYNSRCRAEFHASVATRPCLEIFKLSSTPPSNRVRSAHSP